MAAVLQAQLKRIGMNIRIATMDIAAYNVRERNGTFAFRFRGGGFFADPWTTYARNFLCEADLKRRIANNSGYCNQQVQELLQKAESELDKKKRRELFRQILTKSAEDLPEIHVGFVPRFFTFRENIKGFTTDPDGYFLWSGGGVTHTWIEK